MEWISNPQAWIALATLTALEIVLGIDNIIFISVLVGRLPAGQRNRGRIMGLGLAMVSRILLLLSLTWIMTLTAPLFVIWEREISGRDLILIAVGLFLLAKSTHEIHTALRVRSIPFEKKCHEFLWNSDPDHNLGCRFFAGFCHNRHRFG